MNGKCDKLNCQNDAKYHPVLLFYAPTKYKFLAPIRSFLSLEICDPCSNISKLDDFLTNDGWITICEAISKIGKVIPERSKTQLAWDRIGVS